MPDVLKPGELVEKLKIRLAVTPVGERIGQVMGELSERYAAKHGEACKSREVIVLSQAAALAISLPVEGEQGWTAKTEDPAWLSAAEEEISRLDANVERMIVAEGNKYSRHA